MRRIKELQERLRNAGEERKEVIDKKWIGRSGQQIFIIEMEDSYLANTMRKIAEKLSQMQYLPNVEEFTFYEEVHYKTWMRYLTLEYKYRNAYEEYRVQRDFEEFQNLEMLIQDNIKY